MRVFWQIIPSTLLLGIGACSDGDKAVRSPLAELKSLCGLQGNEVGRFALINGGSFMMGATPIYPEEGPAARVHVQSLYLLTHEVTVGEFRAFVDSTGYLTDAERLGHKGGSAIFTAGVSGGWRLDPNANWRRSGATGPESERMPVTHVSRNDAVAYAAWAGGRLPSEVEWEYAAATGAASAGVSDFSANVWQGIFPFRDEGDDGFRGVAPVGCFDADSHGLYDMIGNVWEWTDTDFPSREVATTAGVIKGGSYLCSDNYCRRFRPEARQGQDVDFSASHIGFRIAKDAN